MALSSELRYTLSEDKEKILCLRKRCSNTSKVASASKVISNEAASQSTIKQEENTKLHIICQWLTAGM